MDYKNTLLIYSSEFEMKANLPKKEPIEQKRWIEQGLCKLTNDNNKKSWILHDGPPYANGNIHVGHALNKIIKDVLCRYKVIDGYNVKYIPGWDTHGLPIEHAVIKTQKDAYKKSPIELRQLCREFATKYINLQKQQFLTLGMLSDFQQCYHTFDHDYELNQVEIFYKLVEKGLVYRSLKPVYWSWSSHTALAEAEIEYTDMKSPSLYVSFPIVESNGRLQVGDQIIIWTTTPWTIPANLAIAAHPHHIYVRLQVGTNIYVIAKELIEHVASKLSWTEYKILEEYRGSEIENCLYLHPFSQKKQKIIIDDYVLLWEGTGLVHNAPDFGVEDYQACKKYNIHPFSPLKDDCKFKEDFYMENLRGIFYDDTNKIVCELLKAQNKLLHLSFITHSAAIDWRTKKPIILRATKQWFIDINKQKENILNAIESIHFYNTAQKENLKTIIKNRDEWCISRQRVWGVPIPMLLNKDGEIVNNKDFFNKVLEIFKLESTDKWFDKPIEYFLPDNLKNKASEYTKETDIMDVWIDSGVSFNIWEKEQQSDLIFEGVDQYRGWFNSSLILSVMTNGKPCFKSLLSHGMTLDQNGNKMSKSIGNVVDPIEVCQKYGADVLRLWACRSQFEKDQRISKDIIEQIAETYRKIRNTLFRFILSNLMDFHPQEYNPNNSLNEVNQYIMYRLQEVVNKAKEAYREMRTYSVVQTIDDFTNFLSTWYFVIIKDSLYCDKKQSDNRREIQYVLFNILNAILLLLSPIIPHTTEEAYVFFNKPNKKKFVALEQINDIPSFNHSVNIDKWEQFSKIKDTVYAAIEQQRQNKVLNKTNQAACTITFNNKYEWTKEQLQFYLNVAEVIINHEKDQSKIIVMINVTKFKKCERCWNYYPEASMSGENICNRCKNAII